MRFKTHFVFGLFTGLLFVEWFNVSYFWVGIVLLFGLIPDIDEYKSKVGKKVFLVGLLFKHRGLVHSLIVPLLIYVVLWFFGYEMLGLAIVFGYCSHLVLDMLNYSGIMLFYPFSSFKIKGFVKNGSFLESVLFFIILTLIVLLIM